MRTIEALWDTDVPAAVGFARAYPALALGVIMMIAGFGFKLALVPFHMWAPDVYEGAPTPITAFLSVASKAAGLAALIRVFYVALVRFGDPEFWMFVSGPGWGQLIAILAAAAMIIGNITAVLQSNVKRMLAYSSIAHAGYLLIGFVALPASSSAVAGNGPAALLFYMFAYMFANMGVFACAIVFAKNYGSYEISDYRGLARKSPGFSILMTIFLLSLAGIPPLAGFFAKYYIFLAGWGQYRWLVIVGILTSVIALYYYVNVAKQMFFSKEKAEFAAVQFDWPLFFTLALTVFGTIAFGIFPESVIRFATEAVSTFAF